MNVKICGNSYSSHRSCKKCGGRTERKGSYYKCKKCGSTERDEETNLEKQMFRRFSYGRMFW